MFKSYFKLALRNQLKNGSSSVINIGGLAVGMAVALLIGLWVYDELSFNTGHANYDRIGRLMQTQRINGQLNTEPVMPLPIGRELQTRFGSEFRYVVMASWQNDHILGNDAKQVSRTGIYMDKDAPAMLSLKMLQGSYAALYNPNSVVLSASTANAIFGKADPIGQLLKIDNKLNVKVTGVYQDLPANSDFGHLSFIAPWALYITSEQWIVKAERENQWDNNSFQTFVQLADKADLAALNKKIERVKLDHDAPEDKKLDTRLFLFPMRDWHLHSHWENGKQTGGAIEYVWMFSLIGVFVLILACINFMNLSTARSEKRAKEVGIRKAIGSLRGQLIWQFYTESLLVALLAFVLALLLARSALPWFNQIAGKEMYIPIMNPVFWLIGLAFSGLTGLIAGSYPALYLSSFQPIRVLKGSFRVGRLAALPRKILVVLQFAISIVLIIGTVIIYKQVEYTKNRPVGYDRSGLLMIRMKSPDFYGKFGLLRNGLKNTGAILEMSESSSPLTEVWQSNNGFEWSGKDPNIIADFNTITVTHDFGKTIGWQLRDGRDFSRDYTSDSSGIIINEAAAKFMGLQHPVGTIVRWGNTAAAKRYTIIGVVKDLLMQSPFDNVRQTIYFMDYDNVNWIVLKLNPEKSLQASIEKVAAVFQKLIPSAPFDYQFADKEFAYKFATEERVQTLSSIFAAFAIFISCLGLFGLASFVAEQRTKEIGIRKVLGATVTNLWGMLSKEFVILVGLSCLIATPLAWYFMNEWLQKYTWRTDIAWWIFPVTAAGAVLLTLLTVSFQAVRAAMTNPVDSLHSE